MEESITFRTAGPPSEQKTKDRRLKNKLTRRVVRGRGTQGRTLPRLADIALMQPNIVVIPVRMMRMRKREFQIHELGRVGKPFSKSVPSPNQTFSPVTLKSWDWSPVKVCVESVCTMPRSVKTRAVERRTQTRCPNIIRKESRTRL